MRRSSTESIGEQVKRHSKSPVEKKPELDGNIKSMVSTGSTLLDLAISGGRVRGGGIPGGIMVEIFGPSGSGKTVLLCEIAGAIQRKNGKVQYHDPEARLNPQFAKTFDFDFDAVEYSTPDTVPQVFNQIRSWAPEGEGVIHGIMADSLAALSTDMEMGEEDGDKMGMRRAKEFSEQLRKTARIITKNNYLLVASNQVRENVVTTPGRFQAKYKTPGGYAVGFYSSLRLKTSILQKLSRQATMGGSKRKLVYGVQTEITVEKSSIWKPHRSAIVTIDFDYGIDDIRENLNYVKDMTGGNTYAVGEEKVGTAMSKAIAAVEEGNLQDKLREQVIDLWEELEQKLSVERKPKKR